MHKQQVEDIINWINSGLYSNGRKLNHHEYNFKLKALIKAKSNLIKQRKKYKLKQTILLTMGSEKTDYSVFDRPY